MNEWIKIRESGVSSSDLLLAVRDTLNVITGKWKLPIIGYLACGKKRFSDMQKNLQGISPRMLSKELKELELNGIVLRIAQNDDGGSAVEYDLTHSGKDLGIVVAKMVDWGMKHRRGVFQTER